MDRTDAELVASHLGGDQLAFTAIYDRYADRLHDFCYSVLRDADAAAEATQDSFVAAADNLGQLRDPDRLRPWLYSIARRRALAMVKDRRRTVPTEVVEDHWVPSETPVDPVEEDELRQLVWDAAGGLEERDRVILDLELRQGLEGQELADALEVERDHAYVLASNLKKRVGRSVGALLVARSARGECPGLDRVLGDWAGGLTPKLRTAITRHVDGCDVCARRRSSLTSPAALFASVPLVPAPLFLRDRVLVSTTPAGAPGRPPRLRTGRARWIAAAAGGAAAAAVVAALVVVLGGGDGDDPASSAPPPTAEAAPADPMFCSVAAEGAGVLGSAGPASPEPADVEAYFRTAAALFADLSALAVAEGRADAEADLEALAGAYGSLVAQLEDVGFALDQVPAAAATLSGDLAATTDRVEAYLREACGIG